MIKCAHTDCNYEAGWTHEGSSNNKLIAPPDGDFYEIKAGFETVNATRFHGDNNKMRLLACPKCRRTFITSDNETYLDD